MAVCVMAGVLAICGAARAVEIETVPVGNVGNVGEQSRLIISDSTYYGAVNYEYNIGKYEVTAGQYCEFLNAVAATDTYELYNTDMDVNNAYSRGCNIVRSGSPGSYTYSVAGDWANRPVNYVSWGDAARFANWLHNGQPTGVQDLSTTEDGAYDLTGTHQYYDPIHYGGLGSALMAVTREPDWTWAIPTEDEWYKAAYHKNDGNTDNYFDYPTSNDSRPSSALTDPDPGNNATFYYDAYGYTIGGPYYRTEVGAHENSDSPYGTFDQGGNVYEWNEAITGSRRGVRGGSFDDYGGGDVYDGAYDLRALAGRIMSPAHVHIDVGFRVVQFSEPATVTRGGGTCTTDRDGFATGGYGVGGMGSDAVPMPFTVDVSDLTLEGGFATLKVEYDPAEVLALGIDEATLRLYWWDEAGSSWVLAGRASNLDQTTGQFVPGPPTDVHGDWGLDMADKSLWANIDHASTYAAAGVPEPATLSMLALAGLAVIRRKRR